MTMNNSDVPSYISSRSANSLISYSRPTRIQAGTLHYLNKILDELLLLILTSAKSLATDRIKSDGILRVLGGPSGSGSGAGALLAKNAVLEAELELRSYLDGQRKEGGKMPLGLSATSRWDGTETFPVQRAYEALRVRCQYYSTLGDLEDPSPHTPQDQNIMSTDGRPIATITPGVAIYVTALLEFVAEYILQNVGRVIERDNSDEAGLSDLIKAMEEDEGTTYWWVKLMVKDEMRAKEKEEQAKGGKGRVGKPWKVPDASEYDEAAGRKKFQRQSLSLNAALPTTPSGRPGTSSTMGAGFHDARATPSAVSSNGHESRDSSTFTSHRVTSPMSTASHSYQTDLTSASSNASTDTHQLTRRASTDKGWFGKRRGSFRSSQDLGHGAPGAALLQPKATPTDAVESEDGSDDFESLMMSGQTMRVSLTPNRLRSIEVSKEKEELDEDAKRSTRRRPGTLSPLPFRDGDLTPSNTTPRSGQPSPSTMVSARMSTHQERTPTEKAESVSQSPRSASRQGSISGTRSSKSLAKGAPPSAYKAVEPTRTPTETSLMQDDDEGEVPQRQSRKNMSDLTGSRDASSESIKLRPRDEARRGSTIRDMVDMFNSTPPSPVTNGQFQPVSSGRESRMSTLSQRSSENVGSLSGRKSALSSAGGKMRNLFGKRTPSSAGSLVESARVMGQDGPGKTPSRGGDGSSVRSYSQSTNGHLQKTLSEDTHASDAGGPGRRAESASGAEMDALTRGLIEGHQRAKDADEGDADYGSHKPRISKDVASVDESYESSDSKYGPPAAMTPHQHTLSSNANVSQEAFDGYAQPAVPGGGASNGAGLVGLYQEPRGSGSTSELSSNNHYTARNEPSSRKVPWSYSRQSSSSRRLSGTPGPMGGIARVGSGASSSAGHGSNGGEGAPPSAWSHGQGGNLDAVTGVGAKTPTPSAPATFAGTSPRSPLSINRPSDTARVLSQLNMKMKDSSTAEECRFLVTQALAVVAAAVHNELEPSPSGMARNGSTISAAAAVPPQTGSTTSACGDIPDEEESTVDRSLEKRGDQAAVTAVPAAIQRESRSTTDAPLKHRNLMLPMAVGYNANEDIESPLHKRQANYAAWLLDGEVFEEVVVATPLEEAIPLPMRHLPPPMLPRTSASSSHSHSADEQEAFASADERGNESPMANTTNAFAKTSPDDYASMVQRRTSKGDSVRSVYRDASDGGELDGNEAAP